MCVIVLILHTFIDASSCMHADAHILHTYSTLVLYAYRLYYACMQIVRRMCVLAFCTHYIAFVFYIYRIFVFIELLFLYLK